MELFLARLIGFYLLIVGLMVVFRKKAIMPAMADLGQHRGVLFAIGAIELAAGLSLAIAYPVVNVSLEGLFSLLGYIMIIESIIYFAFPAKALKKMIAKFSRPEWFIGGGLISIALGVYTLAFSFGLI